MKIYFVLRSDGPELVVEPESIVEDMALKAYLNEHPDHPILFLAYSPQPERTFEKEKETA